MKITISCVQWFKNNFCNMHISGSNIGRNLCILRNEKRFTRQLFQYSVGGMLLIIVFACGFIWSAQTVRKIKQKNKSNSMNSIKDNINKQNKVRHRKRGSREAQYPISLFRKRITEQTANDKNRS